MYHYLVKISFIVILIIISLTPATASATANANAMKMATDTAKQTMATPKKLTNEQYLATVLPSEEVLWLDSENGKFLALKRDYLAAEHKGVAIFISDVSAPINYSLDIDPLRQSINQYGWSSITIHAPSISLFNQTNSAMPEKVGDSATEKADDNKVDNENSMNSIDQSHYAKQLIARVMSAQKFAANQSKQVMLVVQGRQVSYLTDALIQQHLPPLNAIVIIDAKPALYDSQTEQYPATTMQLATQLSMLKVPLLDIYHLENDRTAQEMKARRQISQKAQQKKYRQYLKSTYSKEQQLAKVVYGWLKTLGID